MARSFGIELEFIADGRSSSHVFQRITSLTNEAVEEFGHRAVDRGGWGRSYADSNRPTWEVKTDGSVGDARGYGVEVVSPPLSGSQGEAALRKVLRAWARESRAYERGVEGSINFRVNRTCGHHVHHGVLQAAFFPNMDRGTRVGEAMRRSKRAAKILGNMILINTYWAMQFERCLAPSRRIGHQGTEWAGAWQRHGGARRGDYDQYRESPMSPLGISPFALQQHGWSDLQMWGSNPALETVVENPVFWSLDYWLASAARSNAEDAIRSLGVRHELRNSDFDDWGMNVGYGSLDSSGRYAWDRYQGGRCNMVTSWNHHGTLEFRTHQGTVNAEKIIQWMRLTQKAITIAYAPEHAEKREKLAMGQYDPNSVEDFFEFMGLRAGARKFWAERMLSFNESLTTSARIGGIYPTNSPSRFREQTGVGGGRNGDQVWHSKLYDGTRRDHTSNLAYLNSLI